MLLIDLIEKHSKAILLGVMILVGLLYSNNLSDNFFENFDDDWCIYENPLVQEFNKENLLKIWTNDTKDLYYLPITFTSFAIDIFIWGNNAKFMKIENLFLLFLSAFLLYSLLSQLGPPPLINFFTSVLFTIHPLQLSSIAIATGRRQSLSTALLLLTFIYTYKYITSKYKTRYFWGVIIAFFLTLGAKPSVLTFPFLLFVFIVINKILTDNQFYDYKHVLKLIIPLSILAVFMLYMNNIAGERNFLRQEFNYNTWQHFLIIVSSFGEMFRKIFYGPYIIFNPIDNPNHFRYIHYTILSCITIILLLMGVGAIQKRDKYIPYAISGFFILLIPSSLILIYSSDIPDNTPDRYFMQASPFAFFLISYLFIKTSRIGGAILLLLFSCFSLIVSLKQFTHWESSSTLIKHSVNHAPSKDLMYKLVENYYNQGDLEQSIEVLKQSQTIKRSEDFPFYYTFLKMAQIADAGKESELAYAFLKKALCIENNKLFEFINTHDADIIIKKNMSLSDSDEDNYINYRLIKDKLEAHFL